MPRKARRSEGVTPTEHVRQMLEAQSVNAVAVLIELMQDAEQKPELRLKVAESILDRVCGKGSLATGGGASQGEAAPIRFEGVLEDWSQ